MALGASISGQQDWKRGRAVDQKRLTDAQMLVLIESIHQQLKGAYSSTQMLRELRERRFHASKDRVEYLTRENGIRARQKRRYMATTDSKHNRPVAPHLLDMNFTATASNQVWTAELTYIWTNERWLHLAVAIDLFNREVVGWLVRSRITTEIVIVALTMASFRKKTSPVLIHHSDRGCQHASDTCQARLE